MSPTPLLALVEKYFKREPEAAAHSLETMSEAEAVDVLKAVSAETAAEAVSRLPDAFAASLIEELPLELVKKISEYLQPQQSASIFLHLPAEKRQQFLDLLTERKKRQIQEYLMYPEDSAGRIMTTDFLAFHGDLTVKEAIQKIRQMAHQKGSPASYAYVVDRASRLIGVMNMRDMMLAPDDVSLESVMRKNVFTIDCFMDREKVAQELSARHFFAAPVVDAEKRLLGVVQAEHLIDDVQEEATEDLQKMFGAGGDETVFSPTSFALKKRLPWLHVNLATAFLAAFVVSFFEDLIAKITILAVFLPVVAGQGGNAGAQSLAVVMRGLVMRQVSPRNVKALMMKEGLIGLVNGLIVGLVTALIAWLWHGNPYLGLVVGLGMLVNLVVAGLSGAGIPVIMKAIGLDPAQCSNIILTTITDVMGFFSFLGFALVFQRFLM